MESLHSTIRTTLVVGGLLAAIAAGSPAAFARAHAAPGGTHRTATPIRHVILVLGENRTFDSVFGTWKPPKGQHVKNLLSEGIVGADGSPGPEFARGAQWHARDTGTYSIHPEKTAPYDTLGPITTTGTPSQAPFATVAAARAAEPALPEHAYTLLTEGGSGLPAGTAIDPRFPSDTAPARRDRWVRISSPCRLPRNRTSVCC